MVVVILPSGLVCLEQDLHHLSWIVADMQKEHETRAVVPPGIFGEVVLQFLALRLHMQPMKVAAGYRHTCAVQADGTLVCFGWNDHGQCNIPADLGPITAVAACYLHTCAVQADGTLVCFGWNDHGQCNVSADLGPITAVAAGGEHTCAVQADGTLVCFGCNDHGQCNIPADLGPITAVAAGYLHTCAVQADGTLACFGRNDRGQCNVPADLGPITAVAAGGEHTCAVQADGTLVCFGCNDHGQCNIPADLGPITAVAAGYLHTCAVQADGTLVCFGCNDRGQCTFPADLGPITAVAAGGEHTCEVQADGTLVCFGCIDEGQCNVPADLGPILAMRPTGFVGHQLSTGFDTESEHDAVVEESIPHLDDAAQISPEEALEIVSEQYASWTTHNISAAQLSHHESQSPIDFENVFLHQYSRCPGPFHEVLSNGQELEPVRAALELAGHSWQLPSGAKIFVYPEQFTAVAAVLARRELRAHHVAVAESFEPLVREALSRLPSRQRIDLRQAEQLMLIGGDEIACVERTFLDIPRIMQNSQSVIQSTTEANGPRGPVNPRRFVAR